MSQNWLVLVHNHIVSICPCWKMTGGSDLSGPWDSLLSNIWHSIGLHLTQFYGFQFHLIIRCLVFVTAELPYYSKGSGIIMFQETYGHSVLRKSKSPFQLNARPIDFWSSPGVRNWKHWSDWIFQLKFYGLGMDSEFKLFCLVRPLFSE